MDNSKRNYVRRKKTYNRCTILIKQTLELINLIKETKLPINQINSQAKQHADLVEAVCWDPKMRVSDEIYQDIVIRKTKELCTSLLNKHAPQINVISLFLQMKGIKSTEAAFDAVKQQQGIQEKININNITNNNNNNNTNNTNTNNANSSDNDTNNNNNVCSSNNNIICSINNNDHNSNDNDHLSNHINGMNDHHDFSKLSIPEKNSSHLDGNDINSIGYDFNVINIMAPQNRLLPLPIFKDKNNDKSNSSHIEFFSGHNHIDSNDSDNDSDNINDDRIESNDNSLIIALKDTNFEDLTSLEIGKDPMEPSGSFLGVPLDHGYGGPFEFGPL